MSFPSSESFPTLDGDQVLESPSALVFDLGGVVVDIDFERAFAAWASRSRLTLAEIRRRFSFDQRYEQHERGEIDAAVYFDHIAVTLLIDADHAFIERGWNSIFVSEVAETMALVNHARKSVPCHLFSNTNASHAKAWMRMFPSIEMAFDRLFVSYQMQSRKPEAEAFAHVAREIGVVPGSILFFDDRNENIEGAVAAGMQAVQVHEPDDVRRALVSRGIATVRDTPSSR